MPRRRSQSSAYSAAWSWRAGGCFDATPGATGDLIPSSTSICSARDRRRPPP